jgi:hypothetical protein
VAQKTVVQLVDDLTGESIEQGQGESVRFSLDGTNYEIDLSSENASGFRETLSRYTHAARRVGSSRPSRSVLSCQCQGRHSARLEGRPGMGQEQRDRAEGARQDPG